MARPSRLLIMMMFVFLLVGTVVSTGMARSTPLSGCSQVALVSDYPNPMVVVSEYPNPFSLWTTEIGSLIRSESAAVSDYGISPTNWNTGSVLPRWNIDLTVVKFLSTSNLNSYEATIAGNGNQWRYGVCQPLPYDDYSNLWGINNHTSSSMVNAARA